MNHLPKIHIRFLFNGPGVSQQTVYPISGDLTDTKHRENFVFNQWIPNIDVSSIDAHLVPIGIGGMQLEVDSFDASFHGFAIDLPYNQKEYYQYTFDKLFSSYKGDPNTIARHFLKENYCEDLCEYLLMYNAYDRVFAELILCMYVQEVFEKYINFIGPLWHDFKDSNIYFQISCEVSFPALILSEEYGIANRLNMQIFFIAE